MPCELAKNAHESEEDVEDYVEKDLAEASEWLGAVVTDQEEVDKYDDEDEH